MGYGCGLLREKFPDLIKCLSCEHAFSCSNNLYKLYRTFTDHRPQPKTVAKLQGGHRFISRQRLRLLSTESQTSVTFQRKLTSDELVELTLPQIAKIIQTSQFIYEKCKKKSRETRCEKRIH